MPAAAMTVLPAAASGSATAATIASSRKSNVTPEKKYKCQFCNRAFSRSEHRSRHERSRMSRCSLFIIFFLPASARVYGGYIKLNLSLRLFLVLNICFWFQICADFFFLNFFWVRRYERKTVQMP